MLATWENLVPRFFFGDRETKIIFLVSAMSGESDGFQDAVIQDYLNDTGKTFSLIL